MPTVTFEGKTYWCNQGETVLNCLTRQGRIIASSCRSGICQTCIMRAVEGTPPSAAQQGLNPTLQVRDHFLACICKPTTDLTVALPGAEDVPRQIATVTDRKMLNAEILRLTLQCSEPFAFRAGQFLHLQRSDGLVRSYSIASLPESGQIELHIRRLAGGQMSEWIHDALPVNASIEIAGPSGNCFYLPNALDSNVLLIGTGSGLAPLWGILQDALQQGHRGQIALYHGSWRADGLYLISELRELARQYSNLHYVTCVDEGADSETRLGRADINAFTDWKQLAGWRVFLCGHPDMVKNARKRAFLAGASLPDIFADPFVLSPPSSV